MSSRVLCDAVGGTPALLRRASSFRVPARVLDASVAGICLAAALWLYGGSLHYGFLLDDAMDLPRASGRTYADILTNAGDSTYYRPLVFVLWKSLYDVLGRHDPVILHSLGLLLHSVNGWLVYLLGTRLARRWIGALAALFFLSFPFSYQAVPLINSFFHLLLAAFFLSALLLYIGGRSHPTLRWLPLSLAPAVLACFTHELGIAVGPVALAFEAREWALHRPVRWSWAGAFCAAVVAFVAAWWMMPRWQLASRIDLSSLPVNAAYFAQGALLPVAGQLNGLAALLPIGNEGLIAVASLVTLGVLILLGRAAGRATLLILMAATYGAVVFPAWLMLPYHTYVVDAPRLMYLAAVPAAMIWAIMAGALPVAAGRWRVLGWSVSLVLAIAILWQNVAFVERQTGLMALSGQASAGLVRALDEGGDGRLLVVNFPFWLSPVDSPYLLGHFGHTLLPDYIGLERLAYILTGRQRQLSSTSLPALSARLSYSYGYHGKPASVDELGGQARGASAVYLTEYGEGSIAVRPVGAIAAGAPPAASYRADFGGWVRLEDARYQRVDGDVDLSIRWRSLAPQRADYTVFVHLYGHDGRPVTQADGYPLAGILPPRLWQPGDSIADRRLLRLPPGLPAGDYTLALGWYDRSTGQRAEARTADGEHYQDDVVPIGRVEVR